MSVLKKSIDLKKVFKTGDVIILAFNDKPTITNSVKFYVNGGMVV